MGNDINNYCMGPRFTTRPELVGKQLSKMIGFDYPARDGLRIQAYLSLPEVMEWLLLDPMPMQALRYTAVHCCRRIY